MYLRQVFGNPKIKSSNKKAITKGTCTEHNIGCFTGYNIDTIIKVKPVIMFLVSLAIFSHHFQQIHDK